MATPPALTEDDLYRSSSQFRLWSFSPETLAALRARTHALARERASRYLTSPTADLLTLEEELLLIQRYSHQLRTTSDHFNWPANVKATAVQYLKRFYLSNSVLTYPPKEIYKTALFLACKAEGTHITVSDYAKKISTDPDAVLAPEYKLMQALRFTLDVRQPFRGLKGVLMELLNLEAGRSAAAPPSATSPSTSTEEPPHDTPTLQHQLHHLPPPTPACTTPYRPGDKGKTEARIQAAYASAKTHLDAPALQSDAYLLFTPSQILLAALQLADAPLTTLYLSTKLPPASPTRAKVLAVIAECKAMLAAHLESGMLSTAERNAVEARLEACRDAGTRDLVGNLRRAREGEGGGKAEKKREEREKVKREGEELFGPSLGGGGGGSGG